MRLADLQVLVRQDPQMAAYRMEQFARLQQEVRIAWPSETLVSGGEGLVEQQPARRHAVDQVREDYAGLAADFDGFFPALTAYAAEWKRTELASG